MEFAPVLPVSHRPERVLVTGGAGFIGSNLLLHLVPRYPHVEFVNLDKLTYAGNLMNLQSLENADNYQFVQGDIADPEIVQDLFSSFNFNSVIHCAAESHVDRSIMAPLDFVRTNTLGTVNLLEVARHSWKEADNCRFYHISTDEVFGSLGSRGYFHESTPYDPKSPYSASKASSDHFVRAYAHTYQFPVVISNCSNNYGPYQFPEKLIPLVIQNAIHEQPIPVYGKGENVRDWLHVLDHCRAIETIFQHGMPGRTYLIGGNNEVKNIDLVHLIADQVDAMLGQTIGTSRKLITFVKDRPGHDFRYAIDASRIADELAWSPKFDLERGLRITVAWYLANTEWLDAVKDESYLSYYQDQYVKRT